ncbi:MAG: flagellar export chaperone FlgN [Aquabacterium sp.]
MSRRDALARLLTDLQADLDAAHGLQTLLEQQFQAALRHEGSTLSELGPRIVAQVEAMEARRAMRVRLVARLLGSAQAPSMGALAETLPRPIQTALRREWQALESSVRHCKALNQRNCELIVAQHALMNRVLNGEDHTYAAV